MNVRPTPISYAPTNFGRPSPCVAAMGSSMTAIGGIGRGVPPSAISPTKSAIGTSIFGSALYSSVTESDSAGNHALSDENPTSCPSCQMAGEPHGDVRGTSPNPYLPVAAPRVVVIAAYDAAESTRPPCSAWFHRATSPAVEQMAPEPRACDACCSRPGVTLPSLDRVYPAAARSFATLSHQPSDLRPSGRAISSRSTTPYGLPYTFSTSTPSSRYRCWSTPRPSPASTRACPGPPPQ